MSNQPFPNNDLLEQFHGSSHDGNSQSLKQQPIYIPPTPFQFSCPPPNITSQPRTFFPQGYSQSRAITPQFPPLYQDPLQSQSVIHHQRNTSWESMHPHAYHQPPPSFQCKPPQVLKDTTTWLSPLDSYPPPTRQFKPVLQREKDVKWVQEWLQKQGITESQTTNKINIPIKVSEARQLLSASVRCVRQLQVLQQDMQDSIDCSLEEWQEKVDKAEAMKAELAPLLSSLESKEMLNSLKRLLLKRSKKRLNQQKLRQERKRLCEVQVANRQALHLEIDSWRKKQQEQVLRAKRDEDTKHEADAVLGEVRRKQAEGRHLQQLLSALTKLRQLRAQAAADKGLRPSEKEDERFNQVTEQLSDMWTSQMKSYSEEEHMLRVMLQEEAVAKHQQQKLAEPADTLTQWEELIFGPAPDQSSLEYQLHVRAHRQLEALLEIRKEWDCFVAPAGAVMSSTPPVGWVLPVLASSSNWSVFLHAQH